MDNQHPPGSPPFKPKKPTMKGNRPARRDSPSKPGAPPGPQLPAEPQGNSSAEEIAFKYVQAALTESLVADALPPLISEHLQAPSLEGLDPESISLKQASEGITILIPGSAYLKPGDEFNLLWGSTTYPTHTVDEDNVNQLVMATEWVIHSPTSHIRQGKVEVCYDVYRDGQRIGTSATLHVKVHDTYTPSEKQRKRKRSIGRKNRRRPPL
jgi:hypothetical protein